MKHFLIAFIITSLYSSASSQIYGSTIVNNDPGDAWLNFGYITWWKIQTGPTDSGSFTHFGCFVEATNEATEAHIAIYDHNEIDDQPGSILDTLEFAPQLNTYNQIPLTDPLALSPDTYYWIGIKVDLKLHTGNNDGVHWDYPIKYIVHNFEDPFPDPYDDDTNGYTPIAHAIFLVANNALLILPIELAKFNVNQERDHAKLVWTTSSELNNEGWNIQRSINGYTWETVGWIDGSGTSSYPLDCEYIDTEPALGISYYRLEQNDYDGTQSYSEVKHLHFIRDQRSISLFPNPAQDFVYLKNSRSGELVIYNQIGVLVTTVNVNEAEPIDISMLTNGIYTFLYRDEFEDQKFSVQITR